ncbi:VWA domain-containing protein [Tunturibacter empetritectus]|uniref:VWFA-related protein n=1 Tax=Tunturiibacter lichenicola TaxID=2051959 RepID=A0A7W8N2Q6_9BACT|nr:VWA domain-containing protein [Edaphobacter lichenicola]MBB5343324.1 VWFA-related protein [Edaphobacter lichenicola]
MLRRICLGNLVAMLLWTALAAAQSPPGPSAHHRQVQIPTRPAALFTGEQGKQRSEIHYDPATSNVTMKLLVQDPAGYFIPNLHRDNFAVYENGVRQQNATVEIEHAPITLGIVLEHGGRYKGFNKTSSDEVLRAGQQLLGELGRQDKVAIWEYADRAQQVADFSTGHERLEQLFITSGVPDSSETNFYDALVSTSEAMKTVTGCKALIVITSGVDTFSKAKYADALNAVRASGTPVYIINLGPDLREAAKSYASAGPYAHLDWQKTEAQLREIANVSGGRIYTESGVLDLTPVYDDLMENLRVRYVISYRSTTNGPLDAARTVRVELVDPTTNGPVEIIDANGKVIRSKVVVENSYEPNAAST